MLTRRPPPNPYRCSLHPALPAAWDCLGCRRRLCEGCAAEGGPAHRPLAFCAHCGGGTRPLTVPGVAEGLGTLLRHTLTLPVRWGTLGTGVGVTWVTGLLGRAAGKGGGAWGVLLVLASASLALLAAVLLHASAQGPDRPGAQEGEVRPAVWPAALALWPLCLLLLALPQLAPQGPLWREGLTWGGTALSLLVGLGGPALSAVAAVGRPLRTLRGVLAPGPDLLLAMGSTFGVVLVAWHLLATAVWLERNDASLGFFAVLLQAVSLLALLWLVRLHGLLVHVHAAELGYPLASHHRVAVAPQARPRAAPYRPPAPPPRAPRAPIALED